MSLKKRLSHATNDYLIIYLYAQSGGLNKEEKMEKKTCFERQQIIDECTCLNYKVVNPWIQRIESLLTEKMELEGDNSLKIVDSDDYSTIYISMYQGEARTKCVSNMEKNYFCGYDECLELCKDEKWINDDDFKVIETFLDTHPYRKKESF